MKESVSEKISQNSATFFAQPVIDVNVITLNDLELAVKDGIAKYTGLKRFKGELEAPFKDMLDTNYLAKLYVFLTGAGGNNLKSYKYQVVSSLFNFDANSIKTNEQAFTAISTVIEQLEKIEGLKRQADELEPEHEVRTMKSTFGIRNDDL